VQVIQGGEGAVVRALGLGAAAEVGAELGFLLLGERFGDSGFSAIVMAAEILPELLVDAAEAQQFPIRICEFFDEDPLVRVRGLVRVSEAAAQIAEIPRAFAREEVAVRGGCSWSFD
jgi:hypothetical protein